jgi:hypothetical protein
LNPSHRAFVQPTVLGKSCFSGAKNLALVEGRTDAVEAKVRLVLLAPLPIVGALGQSACLASSLPKHTSNLRCTPSYGGGAQALLTAASFQESLSMLNSSFGLGIVVARNDDAMTNCLTDLD